MSRNQPENLPKGPSFDDLGMMYVCLTDNQFSPGFIVDDQGSGEGQAYLCLACSSSRAIQWSSIHRHCQNISHVRNVEQWSANQKKREKVNIPQERPSGDYVEHPLLSTAMVDSDENDDDLDQGQRTIVELYSVNHTQVFELPDLSFNSPDVYIGHGNDDSDDADSDTDRGDPDDIVIDVDEDSDWAPFTSLEVSSFNVFRTP